MSDTVIHGLRFRRVLLTDGSFQRNAEHMQVCDAMICTRCTAVVRDHGEAERHVCVTRFWMSGISLDHASVPEILPDRMRERVSVANHAVMADLWPHGKKLLSQRKGAPLAERYELLSVLFAELAKMEHAAESFKKIPRRRQRT